MVPAAMSPSRWKRSLSDAEMNPTAKSGKANSEGPDDQRNQRHGIDGAKHVPQHGLPGADRLAMDRDHPNVHGPLAQGLAVPHRLQQAAVEPMDKEQDDQEETKETARQAQGCRKRIPAPARPARAPRLG